MQRRFEVEVKDVMARIMAMGGHVEQAVERATQALNERDAKRLAEVHQIERKINELHIQIDNDCVELLARLGPVATDLRIIIAIIKINNDLERMGDQATNIAHNTEHYLDNKTVDVSLNLPKMSQLVRDMVRDSLDAFMKKDIELAQDVLERDDAVDEFKNNVFSQLMGHMKVCADEVESSLDLILIARNLERMADHATNIAEDVIYAFTGEDVRHGVGQV